jgi:hypothetical protein
MIIKKYPGEAMKLIISSIALLFSLETFANYYAQAGILVWTRNFEEAAGGSNEGVEKTEGGFSIGFGKAFNEKWSAELEYLPSMEFSVSKENREGRIGMMAITVAPKYNFGHGFIDENLSFYAKLRVGWTKIKGTDIYDNYGKETSWTMGPTIGTDYKYDDNFIIFFDVGGLWSGGDVEDYDFFPWQLGLRYNL